MAEPETVHVRFTESIDQLTDEPKPLTDEDLERASIEWIGVEETHRQGGARTAMPAESAWAAEWAERVLAEVRRLRALIERVAKDAGQYDDRDDECCFCGGEDGPNPEPHHHADGCVMLDVCRETRCAHGMDRKAASTGACRECREAKP